MCCCQMLLPKCRRERGIRSRLMGYATTRRYATIYFAGVDDVATERQIVARYDAMLSRGEVSPLSLCFVGELSQIDNVERATANLRSERRFRAVICYGDVAEPFIIAASERELFTGVVAVDANIDKDKIESCVANLLNLRRAPGLWIDAISDSSNYEASGLLDVELCEAGVKHEFRADGRVDILKNLEQQIKYLDTKYMTKILQVNKN